MPGARKQVHITQIVLPLYSLESQVVNGGRVMIRNSLKAQVWLLVFPWPACKTDQEFNRWAMSFACKSQLVQLNLHHRSNWLAVGLLLNRHVVILSWKLGERLSGVKGPIMLPGPSLDVVLCPNVPESLAGSRLACPWERQCGTTLGGE
jgi:hypothetical protein